MSRHQQKMIHLIIAALCYGIGFGSIGSLGLEPLPTMVCEPGEYFNGIKCMWCPGGTYGEIPGLTDPSCSGDCLGGYFCPEGSTSPTQLICGGSQYYCPSGSADRKPVSTGYYTVTYTDTNPEREANSLARKVKMIAPAQYRCEPGFYCIYGIRRPCDAGTFGNVPGLTMASCSGLCPKGFYCPVGTNEPIPCPAGTFGNELGISSPACSGRCPRGHYCEIGTIVPLNCPAGIYGDAQGSTTKACSPNCSSTYCIPSPCPAGFYCPLATTDPSPCGGPDVYCPSASKLPTTATEGYYTIRKESEGYIAGLNVTDEYIAGYSLAEANKTTRSAQVRCEAGAYCTKGIKRLCPEGYYGAEAGLSSVTCSGPCPAGYFCPLGTSDYYQHPCTDRSHYCPQGSPAPKKVDTGYFTVVNADHMRIAQQICKLGSFCVNGVSSLCPPGTYGGTLGLSTSQCSGKCLPGYICPAGSVKEDQTICSAGTYSNNGIFCAPCLPGYYCTAGSSDPKQNPCGSDKVYCPLGSGEASSVSDGYYATGQTSGTHSAQGFCEVQKVAHLPQCPSITIGVNRGL